MASHTGQADGAAGSIFGVAPPSLSSRDGLFCLVSYSGVLRRRNQSPTPPPPRVQQTHVFDTLTFAGGIMARWE